MKTSMTHIAAVVLRQIYLLRSSFTRVIPTFIWVAIDMILWGFITRYLNDSAKQTFSFVPMLLGAVLLWDFCQRVLHGVALAFLEDVWARNFLNFFATPMRVGEYIAGLVGTSILTSTLGLIVMILLSGMFGLSLATYGVSIFPFVLILFLFGIAIGIVGCALVLRFGPAAEWFVWPLPALISPFAGVFYPLHVLPEWMQAVAHVIPVSYVFESLRAIVAGQATTPHAFLIAFGLDVVYILLASLIFARVFKHALRTGLIARYSAESVG